MREIFADSGYWVAMYDPRDGLHRKARDATAQLGAFRIVTSEMVLVEFLNYVSKGGELIRRRAADAERSMRNNPNIYVEPQTGRQFRAATEHYANRLDQRWSVTDCASFLIMRERGIMEALAYDVDFVQAGFRALLREDRLP